MVLVEYIIDRVKNKNKNFVMLFVGPTGSGKSYATLSLAEKLDPTFNIDRCAFKAKDFMDMINKLTNGPEKVPGLVVMWDEFGVEHNAREFMTIANRVINYFFQTSRHLNLIVLMTVPLMSFIDSATRKLCHGIAEMNGIDTNRKTSTIKVKMLQVNALSGKEYHKNMRYKVNGHRAVAKRFKLELPSKKLLIDYEKKKKEFTSKLNIDIISKLQKKEDKEKQEYDGLPEFQQDILQLNKECNGDVKKMAKILDCNEKTVYRAKRKALLKVFRENSSISPIQTIP